MNRSLRHGDMDMTTGSIVRLLIKFTIPLLIGNIFQQLYNTVDSIIVGNYIGPEALAAIGSTTPIVNVFIFFFSGMASGAGVVISNYYGAKHDKKLHSSVQTTLYFTFIMCVIFTVLGVSLTPLLLRLMKTPTDVFPLAQTYLQTIFAGISTLLIYNMGSGILRAVGDSRRPLYVLILCTVINTILDLLFIKGLGMGVRSAAVATVLSQAISSVVVLVFLSNTDGAYRFKFLEPELNSGILKSIFSIGLPSAIQMSLTAFSNVFVMSYINRFGASVMAGWASYIKIDGFALQPITSLGIAVTTFIGQNIGARKFKRAKQSTGKALLIGLPILAFTILILMGLATQLSSLFSSDSEVIKYGAFFIRLSTPFYVFVLINQIYSGALRGSGNSISSMIILFSSFVVCRQIYLYVIWHISANLVYVALGYPFGWFIAALTLVIFYYTKSQINKNAKLYSSDSDVWPDI